MAMVQRLQRKQAEAELELSRLPAEKQTTRAVGGGSALLASQKQQSGEIRELSEMLRQLRRLTPVQNGTSDAPRGNSDPRSRSPWRPRHLGIKHREDTDAGEVLKYLNYSLSNLRTKVPFHGNEFP